MGHSLAGEELSSIGSRKPERVAGLVYLDAGYRYALSGPGLNDLQIDMISMRRYLAHLGTSAFRSRSVVTYGRAFDLVRATAELAEVYPLFERHAHLL